MNTSELKGYLTGLIIGDGYIDSGITKRGFRIKSIYKDFIDQIYNDINSVNTFSLSVHYLRPYIDKNLVRHQECWELYIKSHPYFAKKYHHFFDDYKHRHVSKDAMNWLTPSGLANWYMSDGYVCLVGIRSGNINSRRVDICTDRYTLENINMMCDCLEKKFDLHFSPIKRGEYWRIRLRQKDYTKFINIIKPYIVTSMIDKLYLGYRKQPRWMSDSDWEFQNSISAIALAKKIAG